MRVAAARVNPFKTCTLASGIWFTRRFRARDSVHRDIAACDAFIDALDDPALEQRVRDKIPDNLDEAYRLAVVLEANSRSAEFKASADKPRERERHPRYDARAAYENSDFRTGYEGYDVKVVTAVKPEELYREELNSLKGSVEGLCRAFEEFKAGNGVAGAGQRPMASGAGQRRSTRCFICQDPSHFASACPVKEKIMKMSTDPDVTIPKQPSSISSAAAQGPGQTNAPRQRPNRACFICGDENHLARTCPKRGGGGEPAPDGGNRKDVRANGVGPEAMHRAPVYLRLWYKGQPWECLLDSGCEKSVVPKKMVKEARLEPSTDELHAANGTRIATLGALGVPFRLDGMTLEVEALVSEHVSEPMLGIDWLKRHGCAMDFSQDIVTIRGKIFQLLSKETHGVCRRIVAVHQGEIPAWSQGTIEGRVELRSLNEPHVSGWCTEIGEIRPGLCVARSMVPDRLEKVPVLLMNVTSRPIRVAARTELSELIPVESWRPVQKTLAGGDSARNFAECDSAKISRSATPLRISRSATPLRDFAECDSAKDFAECDSARNFAECDSAKGSCVLARAIGCDVSSEVGHDATPEGGRDIGDIERGDGSSRGLGVSCGRPTWRTPVGSLRGCGPATFTSTTRPGIPLRRSGATSSPATAENVADGAWKNSWRPRRSPATLHRRPCQHECPV